MDATKLLVIAFLTKFLARHQSHVYIREKYGQDQLKLCRSYEKLCIRKEKCTSDLAFLLSCKKEKLVPTFARPKISIKAPDKLTKQIAKLIIKTEIKNKHEIKKQITKELREINKRLKNETSFLLFNALMYRVRLNVDVKRKKWRSVHEKKLNTLRSSIHTRDTTFRTIFYLSARPMSFRLRWITMYHLRMTKDQTNDQRGGV